MFKIDTLVKQEALNFATLMNAMGISEKKLVPLFDKFSLNFDKTQDLLEDIAIWSNFFNLSKDQLLKTYGFTRAEFERLNEDDEIIRFGDISYPKILAITDEAPRFLYLRGRKELLQDKRTVSLVGSRNASKEGKDNTRRVAKALGNNGIIVASGLAKGIDVTAHITALENNYNTIAVIGTNLNQYYPNENRKVQLEIEKKGLVVSQFAPSIKTERWFFPLRNGVMSGLSLATVIMEAGETSGSLRQAEFALKQDRLVMIPQNVFNISSITWPDRFVKKGAKIVKSPKEIIDCLSESRVYVTTENKDLDLFEADFVSNLFIADNKGSYHVDKSK